MKIYAELREYMNTQKFRIKSRDGNTLFPGGLGPEKLVAYAHNNYGVEITEDEAAMMKRLWLDAFPEMKEHLRPLEDQKYDDDDEGQQWYIAETINGRRARKSSYNAACNYKFQGLTADGAKRAAWFLYLAKYRVVNFVHDEFLVELPMADKQQLQLNCRNVERIMIDSMRYYIPDVTIKTEGALIERWNKEAKPLYDKQGNLLLWSKELEESMKREAEEEKKRKQAEQAKAEVTDGR